MTEITAHRLFDAPTELVWEVVTDPDVYAAVAPNLSSVVVLDGDGEGMVRRCVDTEGNAWRETCHHWEPGRGFAVAVDTEGSEFHRPWFTRFEGRWELTERDDGVLVTVRFEFDTRYGPLGALLARYFRYRAVPLVDAVFDGWHTEIETRQTDPATTTGETDGTDVSDPGTRSNQLFR
jgi:uncharacterized protein YndB with AHSA1/START domain